MFYEIRCGDRFPGRVFERFDKPPTPGDVVEISPMMFVVVDVVNENGRPVVELAHYPLLVAEH